MSKLDEIKQALETATRGPWTATFNDPHEDGSEVCSIMDTTNAAQSGYVADAYRGYVGSQACPPEEYKANAHLIANAPTWLAELVKVAEAARAYLVTHPDEYRDTKTDALRKALEAFK